MTHLEHLEHLAVFALPPSEALGRAVAADCGLSLAPHELQEFDDGEHQISTLHHEGSLTQMMNE